MRKLLTASPFPTARKPKIPVALSHPRGRPATPARSESTSRLGEQIKALRVACGASGGELARRCGISSSLLSRVERGLVSPSVETLNRIAQGLDVPLSRFFSDQRSRTDLSFVPAGHGIMVERIGAVADYRYELLGHLLSGNLFVEPYLVTLQPQARPYTSFQHPGLKFLYLMSGSVSYRYGGKLLKLGRGDALLFDASALHGVEAIIEAPVSYLAIVFSLRD
ncbi:XRE family transcriptional regulator [Variovorax sp. LjRoot84]